MAVDAVQVTLGHSRDVSGLERLVSDGRLRPDEVVAVTGKTEGCTPGETSRVDADHAVRRFLAEHGTRTDDQIAQVPMVFTSGGVGILTPQLVVYSRRRCAVPDGWSRDRAPGEPAADGESRLALGTARTTQMRPEWTGTSRVIEETAAAVRAAAAEAGIAPETAEYVIGKAYHVPQQALAAARAGGQAIPAYDDHTLFRKTSGSAALGVGTAVEGLPVLDGDDVGVRMDVWSGRASISANEWEGAAGGPDTQLILFGNRAGAGGTLRVGHAVITDLLDVDALPRALRRAGMDVGTGPLTPEQRARVVAVYVKIGPPPDGLLRGRRQVLENPSYDTEMKAAVAGMYAAWLQDTLIWISGSATHQGPPGGGTLATIINTETTHN
ncbi:ring-opening amidohydrolase [Kribbella sp.]|uniref:ring-opening amidohydrolase n=1 Tax=Kribbella sp. TaxID=1871183 RepID=UPI002D4D79B7|nr:ring-opening amidohydrolase [Kribbella sp.]HZX02089.1 ring-opening amidohydrolase [Kribbella sp.]